MRLIYLTLAWLMGIWLAAQLEHPREWVGWLLLVLVFSLALVVSWRQRWRNLRGLSLILLVLPLGALRYGSWPQSDAVAAWAGQGGISLFGVVSSEPTTRGITTQFQLNVQEVLRDGELVPVRGKVWVRARRELPLAYGDYLRATGILTLPFEIDAFSYADYLARQGVFSVLSNAHIQQLGSGYGNRLRAGLLEVRNAAKERIGQIPA